MYFYLGFKRMKFIAACAALLALLLTCASAVASPDSLAANILPQVSSLKPQSSPLTASETKVALKSQPAKSQTPMNSNFNPQFPMKLRAQAEDFVRMKTISNASVDNLHSSRLKPHASSLEPRPGPDRRVATTGPASGLRRLGLRPRG